MPKQIITEEECGCTETKRFEDSERNGIKMRGTIIKMDKCAEHKDPPPRIRVGYELTAYNFINGILDSLDIPYLPEAEALTETYTYQLKEMLEQHYNQGWVDKAMNQEKKEEEYTCPECYTTRTQPFPTEDETNERYCPDCNTTLDEEIIHYDTICYCEEAGLSAPHSTKECNI